MNPLGDVNKNKGLAEMPGFFIFAKQVSGTMNGK